MPFSAVGVQSQCQMGKSSLGLRWGDVDFERIRRYVQQAMTVGTGGKPIIMEPKTSSGRRTITLPLSIMLLLTEPKERQQPEGVTHRQRLRGRLGRM